MAAVGKLGQTVSVSPVGGALKSASANGVSSEWLPAASDEEAMLHQLRAALLQARDAPPGESRLSWTLFQIDTRLKESLIYNSIELETKI